MSFSSGKSSFFIAVLMLVFSCGKSSEQEVKDAVLDANILLSTSQCQPAIDLLESIGRQNSNAYYLKALSTAYACRAGYSSVTLFGTDLEKTASPAPLGGMTTYSTSNVSATSPLTDDLKYRDLQTAIDILLYAGGIPLTTEPTGAARATRFSANHAADINTQIAFMMMVQAGKFMKVYADADANGVKSLGSGSNLCFTDYPTIDPGDFADLVLSGTIGHCTSQASPHPQLSSSLDPVVRKKRLCEGVVLFNGIIDLLPNIIASAGGTELGDIGAQLEIITQAREDLEDDFPGIGAVVNVLSQTNCEADPLVTQELMEIYYAVFLETMIE
jgi:hypothetical protein